MRPKPELIRFEVQSHCQGFVGFYHGLDGVTQQTFIEFMLLFNVELAEAISVVM